jgi:hypothetical protein
MSSIRHHKIMLPVVEKHWGIVKKLRSLETHDMKSIEEHKRAMVNVARNAILSEGSKAGSKP